MGVIITGKKRLKMRNPNRNRKPKHSTKSRYSKYFLGIKLTGYYKVRFVEHSTKRFSFYYKNGNIIISVGRCNKKDSRRTLLD